MIAIDDLHFSLTSAFLALFKVIGPCVTITHYFLNIILILGPTDKWIIGTDDHISKISRPRLEVSSPGCGLVADLKRLLLKGDIDLNTSKACPEKALRGFSRVKYPVLSPQAFGTL